jgi:hypothetical protein
MQGPYRRFVRPDGTEWVAFLKRWGRFYSMGSDCYILPDLVIADPALLRIGNNLWMTGCTLLGHDGSVAMINGAYGLKFDHVGKIDIGSNVFVAIAPSSCLV